MKVFQIGFNKCGTRSLCKLFSSAGHRSLHWAKGKIARDIKKTFDSGGIPLLAWPDVVLFTDMELINDASSPLIEGYRHFEFLHKHYPDARFILNLRDREDWLFSRVDHGRGRYLAHYRRHYGLSRTRDVMDRWRQDWDTHIAAVRAYFSNHPGAIVEFDIKNDSVQKLKEFFAPELDLDGGEWGQFGKTRG